MNAVPAGRAPRTRRSKQKRPAEEGKKRDYSKVEDVFFLYTMTLAGSDHGPVAMTSALFSADKSGAFFAFARPVFAASASAALRSERKSLFSSFVAPTGVVRGASSGHRVRPPRAPRRRFSSVAASQSRGAG